jgi:hypothetical protein
MIYAPQLHRSHTQARLIDFASKRKYRICESGFACSGSQDNAGEKEKSHKTWDEALMASDDQAVAVMPWNSWLVAP